MKVLSVATLLAVAGLALGIEAGCLYNQTHCACRPVPKAGTCARFESGTPEHGYCRSEQCKAGGKECHCAGTSLCAWKKCPAWKFKNGAKPAWGTSGHQCERKPMSATCLHVVGNVPPVVTQPPTGGSGDYRMVQLGEYKPGNLFNMTIMEDENNFISKQWNKDPKVSMHDRWPHKELLKRREIQFRMYANKEKTKNFVCMIINDYKNEKDTVNNYKVKTEIKGLQGQKLRFAQCDDHKIRSNGTLHTECSQPMEGNVLTSDHDGDETHSDGFCIEPLTYGGDSISIKVKDIFWISAINFVVGDDHSLATYKFAGGEGGLTGNVNGDGYVQGGAVPEIIIKLAGIPYPQA